MMQTTVLAIADNLVLYQGFRKIIAKKQLKAVKFDFRYSYNNEVFAKEFKGSKEILPINVKKDLEKIIKKYNLVISVHCKQIFPPELINKLRCINFHPGLNPYNRGWFPQVFSILNGLPVGATIHEIDAELDHGNIIAQKEVKIYSYDTSYSVYRRIIKNELELIEQNIEAIIFNKYQSILMPHQGNINFKKDFENLCKLDLNEKGRLNYFINKLRALSHKGFKNAYFIDFETGKKIFVRLELVIGK